MFCYQNIYLYIYIYAYNGIRLTPRTKKHESGSRPQNYRVWSLELSFLFSLKMDDDRKLRVPSGSLIGAIMLLLALLPRDIRSDLIARLYRMSTEKAIERDQVSEVGPTTAALEGEVRGQQQLLIDESLKTIFLLYLRTITHSIISKQSLLWCKTNPSALFSPVSSVSAGSFCTAFSNAVRGTLWTASSDLISTDGSIFRSITCSLRKNLCVWGKNCLPAVGSYPS